MGAAGGRVPFKAIFIAIVFLGSFLLFLVQPLVARMALPVLGGSPSVWNTAMLFYQAALLLGYAYAHALQRLSFRTQAGCHLLLFGLSLLTLPISLASIGAANTGTSAVWWLLQLLAFSIGPVFVLVAAQAPLMQAWFSRSDDERAASPWFLYAASNIGSLLGLLSYPFVLEPFTGLKFQQNLWSGLYLLLILLVALGAYSIWKTGVRAPAHVPDTASIHGRRPVTWRRRLHWLALAAVPSGLMLSTTTHLTTDIMSMPLLWVLPLSIYLISFILVFSRFGPMLVRPAIWIAPFSLLVFGAASVLVVSRMASIYGLASLLLLLVVAVVLHGVLAEDRPAADRLTEYYLLMAAGGALGGLFPALVAPQIFDWVYEHPILLLAAAFLVPAKPLIPWLGRLWRTRSVSVRALKVALPLSAAALGWWLGGNFFWYATTPYTIAIATLLALMGILAIGNRLMFPWMMAMLMLGVGGWQQIDISTMDRVRARSFFGIYTIELDPITGAKRLLNGTTLHGSQSMDPYRSRMPLTYYAPGSGAGLGLIATPSLFGPDAKVGVVGLGTGSLICYATSSQDWTVYEIDPLAVEIATDPARFSYIDQCKPDIRIVVGDARLKLAEEPDARFDVLAVDAFSSDAIPLHLMTREAFETYERVLSPEGVLLVHISNRYIDLQPVVAAIAQDLGLASRILSYFPDGEGMSEGYSSSIWIALTKSEESMTNFTEATGASSIWEPNLPKKGFPAWADDFASVLPVLHNLSLGF